MKRRWLTVAMIASIFGAVCSVVSLQNYLRIHEGGVVAEDSFCSISESINCDVVEASSYASVGNIPIAGLGLIYYILILVFSAVARFSRGFKKPTVAFAWWSSILAVLYSILLAYISLVVMRTVCITCLGMYSANFILFISLFLAMRIPPSEWFSFLWGYWLTILARKKRGIDFMPKFGAHLLAFIIVFGIGLVFISSATGKIKRMSDAEIANYVDHFYKQSKYDIKFDKAGTSVWGVEGAPVTIVEFSDYRCPFCRISAFLIKPFLAEYKNNVAYYFVNYPLDSTCNHYMQQQMHPGACLGAKAGICAEKFGKYWEYHDEMFKSTEQITMLLVMDIVKKLGIDGEKFAICLNSAETERKLRDDIEASRRIYITGTPTVFVNDRRLKSWKNPEVLRDIVSREIKAAGR